MAKTFSTMAELGSQAPHFSLPNYNSAVLDDEVVFSGLTAQKGLLLAFICNHCPYVVKIAQTMSTVLNKAQQEGLMVVAINANDVENYPADSPENMRHFAQQYGFEFPYVFDATQAVAKAYDAVCTPDFFLYQQNAELVYRGRFDAVTPGNAELSTGQELQAAIDNLVDAKPPVQEQLASIGCNIKWFASS